jgi:hypothetical protein
MKMLLPILAVSLFLLVVLPCSTVLADNRLTEQQALDVLMAKVHKDKLYDSWTTISCLSFLVEEKTKDYIDIAIREKHEGKCEGDPNTAPIVDRFRVHRLTKRIQWYEPAEGNYNPYRAVLKARLEK